MFSYDCKGDTYKKLHVLEKQQRRPRRQIGLKNLYTSQLPITHAKKQDLLKLCKTNLFYKEHHAWIEQLKSFGSKQHVEDKTPEPITEEYFEADDLENPVE